MYLLYRWEYYSVQSISLQPPRFFLLSAELFRYVDTCLRDASFIFLTIKLWNWIYHFQFFIAALCIPAFFAGPDPFVFEIIQTKFCFIQSSFEYFFRVHQSSLSPFSYSSLFHLMFFESHQFFFALFLVAKNLYHRLKQFY